MTSRRRICLNPCDCCIYGHHRWLARRQRGGNIAFMMVDVEGIVDPAAVRQALTAVMTAYPVTLASLGISPLRLRPFWKLPSSTSDADVAAERAHVYDDLRADPDATARLNQLCTRRYGPDWDLSRGPQVRLEQYALPGDRTRLCLRWPHFLMDAEGAQWFLSELGRHFDGTNDPSQSLLPADDPSVEVLAQMSPLARVRFMMRGLSAQKSPARSQVRHVVAAPAQRVESYQFLHRCWRGQDFERIRERAHQTMPPGPALYGRYLAAIVLQALDRVYREEGFDTQEFAITFPMKVRITPPGDEAISRPMTGNFLVTPTLVVDRGKVGDLAALGSDIQMQLQAFLEVRGDKAQWALLEAAALIHAWFYPALFRFAFAGAAYSSGFSYYGEIDRPLRRFAGAEVTNIWGGGPSTTPPGWNPVFSRYGDNLNLSLTWTRPHIPDALAERYANFIGEFVLAR
ncbi:MAG TPA: hypothetical protein VJZ71_03890 [Phycisphaerae bacterium]|nr:hypothetical protein [Phycisphaerae bacterium]